MLKKKTLVVLLVLGTLLVADLVTNGEAVETRKDEKVNRKDAAPDEGKEKSDVKANVGFFADPYGSGRWPWSIETKDKTMKSTPNWTPYMRFLSFLFDIFGLLVECCLRND